MTNLPFDVSMQHGGRSTVWTAHASGPTGHRCHGQKRSGADGHGAEVLSTIRTDGTRAETRGDQGECAPLVEPDMALFARACCLVPWSRCPACAIAHAALALWIARTVHMQSLSQVMCNRYQTAACNRSHKPIIRYLYSPCNCEPEAGDIATIRFATGGGLVSSAKPRRSSLNRASG